MQWLAIVHHEDRRPAHRDTILIGSIEYPAGDEEGRTTIIRWRDTLPMMVGQIENGEWWIIPCYRTDEAKMDDIGPFDDTETCMAHFILNTNTKRS